MLFPIVRYISCFSAGIGRTGTLLTIGTCMKHIERGLEVIVFQISSQSQIACVFNDLWKKKVDFTCNLQFSCKV